MNFTLEKALLLLVFAALFASLMANAAEPARAADARQRYQHDRADCMSGITGQDKMDCLREAGAALNEAKSGRLADPNPDFDGNRVARCAFHTGSDREYCLRRMNGEGTVSGSVAGGGILRELVVTVPASENTPAGGSN